MNDMIIDDDERMKRQDSRKTDRKRRRRRRLLMQILKKRVLPILVVAAVIFLIIHAVRRTPANGKLQAAGMSDNIISENTAVSEDKPAMIMNAASGNTVSVSDGSAAPGAAASGDSLLSVSEDDSTVAASGDVVSSHAILISLSENRILSERDAHSQMYPASMTKILTVLVAAEHLKSMDDLNNTVTITAEEEDFSYSNDCSNVGFSVGEVVPVKDLFYGTILPSGADAADALAIYTAGSQEAFVKMMNRKCQELGISKTTHFTNPVGIYSDDHYSTACDMAVIINAAVHNELCREVMSTHTYTTAKTSAHPDGITVSNWFLRRIEDKDAGGKVICGKTGYVIQSGNCAASYAEDAAGNGYICVTGGSTSAWRCIFDQVALYKKFM